MSEPVLRIFSYQRPAYRSTPIMADDMKIRFLH